MAKSTNSSDSTVDEQPNAPSILDGSDFTLENPEPAPAPQAPALAPVVEVSSQPAHLLWYEGKPEKESHLYQEATLYDASGTIPTYGIIENEYDDGTVEVRTPLGLSQRVPLVLEPTEKPSGYTVYLGHASGPQVVEEVKDANSN